MTKETVAKFIDGYEALCRETGLYLDTTLEGDIRPFRLAHGENNAECFEYQVKVWRDENEN
jgi:hypothetical protein